MKRLFFSDIALSVSLLLALAIASTEAPVWASAVSFIFITWRFLHEKFNVYKLSPKITPLFGVMFFAIVYLQYRTIFGQEESLTILIGLTSITILNYSTLRDHLFMVLLGFLMLVLKSVFSIDFIWMLPALISFFGLWLSLLLNSNVKRFEYIFKTLLRGIPLLVILFLVFPRIVLFQTEQLSKPRVQSGFTEELTPGRFSQIALSDQMAFRVEFINVKKISSEQLYWRGAVLTQSNGFIWTKRNQPRKNTYVASIEDDSSIEYRVIVEPIGHRSAFVLDKPLRIKTSSEPIFEREHATYLMNSQPQQMVQYIAYSNFSELHESPDDPIAEPRYLKASPLPPKTLAWVQQVKEKHESLEERLKELILFFEQPGFVYTLSPGSYDNDMDEFLFERKKGFCEHYAAAFGSMARSLGIPARVVIGYQGGSYNQMGNFWKISQKDAHAWVEVGLKQKWKRIDPTGLVTPLRISLGSEDYFSLSEEERNLYSKNRNFNVEKTFKGVYLTLLSILDSLNYTWTMFLLNYDMQTQLEILKGFKGSWFYYLFGFLGALLVFIYWLKNRPTKKANQHEYYQLLKNIEKWALAKNIGIQASTTPLQILDLTKSRYPQMEPLLTQIAIDYEKIVYQEKLTNHKTAQYQQEFNNIVRKINKEVHL